MGRKEFLENNKEELSEVITKINVENDYEIEDFILEVSLKIAAYFKYDITVEELEDILLKLDIINLRDSDTELEELLSKLYPLDIAEEEKKVIDVDDDYSENIYLQYSREIHKYKVLSREEEVDLFTRYNNGEKDLKDKILLSNLALVMSVAKCFKYRDYHELMDYNMVGKDGLEKAIESFDVSLGFKFSTYAIHKIHREIQKYVGDTILQYRLPHDVEVKRRKIYKTKAELYQLNGREATLEELSKATKIPEKKLLFLTAALETASSINSPSLGSDETEFLDYIPDTKTNIVDFILSNNLSNELEEAMNAVLDEREIEVLKLRYGFFGRVFKAVEIAKMYGITSSRIGQIERNALKKLEEFDRKGKLKSYLYK